jgi:hypothetical protein
MVSHPLIELAALRTLEKDIDGLAHASLDRLPAWRPSFAHQHAVVRLAHDHAEQHAGGLDRILEIEPPRLDLLR